MISFVKLFMFSVALMSFSLGYAQMETQEDGSEVQDANVTNTTEAADAGTADATDELVDGMQTELQVMPWDKISMEERLPLAYDHIREADVFWYKILWRLMDTREKMNRPLASPKAPLISVIMDAAKQGEVTLYDGLDDEFTTPVNMEEIPALSSQTDSIYVYNPATEMDELTIISNEFNPESVTKYRLKEIWYFNEETSTMESRILGIAPIMEKYGEFGNYQGDVVIFWAYFPELRDRFVRTEAYNPFPNGIKLTFDDLFALRLFSSTIIKQDNVDDLRIQDYKTGINALYEAERIKEELFNFEHDLWSY